MTSHQSYNSKMCNWSLSSLLVLICACSITWSPAFAETIEDEALKFSLTLPDGFVARPDLQGVAPNVAHAFEFGDAAEDGTPILLFVEKLGGVIGRERINPENMPAGFAGRHFVTTWQGFELDAFAVPESLEGMDVITYNVQIPLRGQAIQLKLFGPQSREERLQQLQRQLLDNLQGETNWLASAAPTSVVNSDSYATTMLAIGIGIALAVLVALFFISRVSPKGTVLIIAICLYAFSYQIDDSRIREVRLASGLMRMVGFAGGILGVIDLWRKPKQDAAAKSEADPRA